jgi:hypothetical protein
MEEKAVALAQEAATEGMSVGTQDKPCKEAERHGGGANPRGSLKGSNQGQAKQKGEIGGGGVSPLAGEAAQKDVPGDIGSIRGKTREG